MIASDFLRDIFGIASALIGVALIALLVGNASKTVQVVQASTTGFNSLLDTITLQNSMGSLNSGVTF